MPTRQEARVFRGLASCFSNFHLFLAFEDVVGRKSAAPSDTSMSDNAALIRPTKAAAENRHLFGSGLSGLGMVAIHSKNRPHQATRDRKGNFGAKNCGPDIPHLFQMVRAPLGVHVLFCVLEGKIP